MGTDSQQLQGAALDVRVKELGIERASSLSADDKRAKVAEAEAALEEAGKVRLRTAYPIDRFDHGIEGIPAITAVGVEVPADRENDLRDLAIEYETKLERA